MALEAVGDVALGVHQKIAWQTDNAFIRPATGRWRQFGGGCIRDINADHGKIPVFKLPNVWAAPAADSVGSIFVRVRTDALCEHGKYITTVKYAVKPFFAYSFGVPSGIKQRAICGQVIRLLREERERRGLSKYAVSAQCGITQQTISYMERGLRHPSFETILRIADGIGVNLEDILKQARSAANAKRK